VAALLAVGLLAFPVGAGTVYVAPGGQHIPPYTNWVEAATNIQSALDVAGDGDTVLLEETTFYLYSTLRITNAITLRSNGWTTYLQGPYWSSIYVRGIQIERAGVTLDRIYLSYFGGPEVEGADVYLAAPATLTNCYLNYGYSARGGGVYVSPAAAGSLLVSCQFNDNMAYDSGGGLYAAGSTTVYGCDFRYNYAYTNAGAVWLSGASVLRNNQIHDNYLHGDAQRGAGVYCGGPATIESCTIVRNQGGASGGGLAAAGGAVGVWNTLLWSNSAAAHANCETTGILYAHCCASPVPAGTNNVAGDPQLPPYDGLPGLPSSCINRGTNQAWMTGAKDVSGSTDRIVKGIVDIGAYEVPYGCVFTPAPAEGFAPLPVVLTAQVYGGNTTDTWYRWVFDASGTNILEGYGLHTVTNVYRSCGTHRPTLQVTSPEYDYGYYGYWNGIKVGPQYLYVSPTGSNQSPYTNWSGASTSIAVAVDAAVSGSTIFLTNVTYNLNSYVYLNKAITLKGVGEPKAILDARQSNTCVYANVPGVVLDNLTLTGGRYISSPGGGGASLSYGGTVRNCTVISNQSTAGSGGGVYGGSGTNVLHILDSRLEANVALNFGGGAYSDGPMVVSNSTVVNNRAAYGGGIAAGANASIEACLIAHNQATSSYGGGVAGGFYGSTEISRCTIVSNSAASDAGGLYVCSYYSGSSADRCDISYNTAGQRGGGAMLQYQARLTRCRITDNRALAAAGGGVASYDGTLRNCLLARNESRGDGGGVFSSGVLAENCTIAFNRSYGRGGGIWSEGAAAFSNDILYANWAVAGLDAGQYNPTTVFYDHCSATDTMLPGTNNVIGDPLFANPITNDFRIRYGSVALDAGTNQAWMSGATDLNGKARVVGSAVDIGACEFDSPPLGVGFAASPGAGYAPLTVVFTARLYRAILTPVAFQWDFDNNGTVDAQGDGLSVVTNVYSAPGSYAVRVAVSNTLGQSDAGTRPGCARVWSPALTNYVSSGGTHIPPFTNWVTAATNIQSALDAAVDGGVVMLASGAYAPTGTPLISKAITLRGPDTNPVSAVLGGGDARRCLVLANPLGRVAHLTIADGFADRYGGGIYAPQGGTISNCVIRDSHARFIGSWDPYGGGGIYLARGLLANCRLENNSAQHYGGGALLVENATARSCVFVTNTITWGGGGGGGLTLSGGLAENCLVLSNAASYGAGAYVLSGALVNCTFAENIAAGSGGGLFLRNGAVADRCRILRNWANIGGGVYMPEAQTLLRSSLVASNSAGYDGGGVYLYAGIMENCTVAANVCTNATGGVGYDKWSSQPRRIANTIIYYNVGMGTSNDHSFVTVADADMDHVCTTRIPAATPAEKYVITNNPLFANVAAGDFRIGSGSPCFNSGLNETWMVGALDLDGSNRVVYGQVDMGAYESTAPTIVANFAAEPRDGRVPLNVTFHGSFVGVGETNTVRFAWDFNNDGTFDQWGLGLHTVTNRYTGTLYHTVSLFVSNTVAGLTDTETKPNYIRAMPVAVRHYVSTNGLHIWPYTNWVNAATNALAAAAATPEFDQLVVGTGRYLLAQTLVVSNEIELLGAGAAGDTILDGRGSNRCVLLSRAGATLRNVTLQNGYAGASGDGGGILMTVSGNVFHCIITSDRAANGAGIDATNGGWIADCVIVSNRPTQNGVQGAGLRIAGGTLAERCWIQGNYCGYGGGAACLAGGTLRNSAVAGNTAGFGGGVYLEAGGLLQSCSVGGNFAAYYGGIYSIYSYSPLGEVYGKLENTVVFDNTHLEPGPGADIGGYMDDVMFERVCVGSMPMEGLSGAGLVLGNPNLADPTALNLRLMPGSVALDAGAQQTWMTGNVDVEGSARIRGADVDLGAYEFNPDPLSCWFSRSATNGWTPLSVELEAFVSGSNATSVVYCWDTDGNGTWDRTGSGLSTLAVVYLEPSNYFVRLLVTNGCGESTGWEYPTPIHVAPGTIYVSTNGASIHPFASWLTAATNIHRAVDMAEDGTLVLVGDGTYALTNQLLVDCAAELASAHGRDRTVLQAAVSNRVLHLNAAGAVVDGFGIRGGYKAGSGGGVLIDRGATLRNGRLWNNTALLGGGICVDAAAARVERCLIENNLADSTLPGGDIQNDGRGGGVYALEGTLDRCVIRNNSALTPGGFGNGGGVMMAGAEPVVQNSLIYSNVCNNLGGGVFLQSGRILNCTIVLNAAWAGQELWWHQHTYGAVESSIMRHTLMGNTTDSNSVEVGYPPVFFTNCCADLDLPGSGNLHADPLFALTSAAWYALQPGSPCVDAGMTNALTLDLDGLSRPVDGDGIGGARVDIGASECRAASLDTDGDGLPDQTEAWQAGSDSADPDTDDDLSGDLEEWIAGTSPTDAEDIFKVLDEGRSAAGVVVRWRGALGRLYTLQSVSNLMQSWSGVTNAVDLPGTGGTMSRTNAPAGREFHRVSARLP
jgi:hypothetical protein